MLSFALILSLLCARLGFQIGRSQKFDRARLTPHPPSEPFNKLQEDPLTI